MDRKALLEEMNRISVEIKAFHDQYQGDQIAPGAEITAMMAKADRMDEITKELEQHTEQKAQMDRLARAMATTSQPAGHAPLTDSGVGESTSLVSFKDGFAGLQFDTKSFDRRGALPTDDAGFMPLWEEGEFKRRPDLQHAARPEYKAVFSKYLRGQESYLTPEEKRLLIEAKALSEGANTGGGFAVPIDFIPQVIKRLPGMASFAARATHIATNRDQVSAPRIKANTGSYSTMYTSAVTGTWVTENPSATVGQQAPVFEAVNINVNTSKLETVLSKNLIQDAAFNVGAYLSDEFNLASNLQREQAFLVGTGVAQPMGVTLDGDITTINNGNASAVTSDDPKNLLYALAVQYQMGAEFWLSLDALKHYRLLKDSNGNYIWSPGFAHGVDGGTPSTLEGKPYNVSDFLQSVGASNIPMFAGNPKYYWAVDRLDMSIQVLTELYAESNQIAYLAFFRVGGKTVLPQAFRTLTIHT